MTAKEIINGWCDRALVERSGNKVFPNIFIGYFEADILEITKSGYAYEYEVKISKSDFINDSKKRKVGFRGRVKSVKVDELRSGNRVNYFYYVVPEGLVSIEDIPDYAGLIYVREIEVGYFSYDKGHYTKKKIMADTIKAAPKLTKDKFSSKKYLKCMESMYYRFHSMRQKSPLTSQKSA